MSISEEVNQLCERKQLFVLLPGSLGKKVRTMCVAPDIYDRIHGKILGEAHRLLWARVRAHLMKFVSGDVIQVRVGDPYQEDPSDMVRLHAPEEEVWEFRYPEGEEDADMAVRIFGRFAGPDCFIGLRWELRSLLGYRTDPQWERYKRLVKEDWERLLPTHPPFAAKGYPDDYISDALPC